MVHQPTHVSPLSLGATQVEASAIESSFSALKPSLCTTPEDKDAISHLLEEINQLQSPDQPTGISEAITTKLPIEASIFSKRRKLSNSQSDLNSNDQRPLIHLNTQFLDYHELGFSSIITEDNLADYLRVLFDRFSRQEGGLHSIG